MITISKPYITTEGNDSFLRAKIKIDRDIAKKWINYSKRVRSAWKLYEDYPPKCWEDENFTFWFKVESKYKEYLCEERSDAFIIGLLYYAMCTGADIISEAPISARLLYKLNYELIPILCNEKTGYNSIKIHGPVEESLYPNIGAVGTGMSCGIDSFSTLYKHISNDMLANYRLTHLTYFNMGAIFHPKGISNKSKMPLQEMRILLSKMAKEKLDNAKYVAKAVDLPLVYVESNLDSDIYRGAYGFTAVYRNISMVLSLQGLFGKYIHSTAGWPPGFFETNLETGSEHYELLLFDCFNNHSVDIIPGGQEDSRLEKTKKIINKDLVKEKLDVCFNFNNCGHCSKCYRTLITLEILGKLDLYSSVFDIDKYKGDRHYAYEWLLNAYKSKTDPFSFELYHKAKEKKLIPNEAYYLFFKKRIKQVLRKPYRKINRIKD